jgi:hypothetical protein
MARKIGSKDINKRSSKKSAYETYSFWYDKYTKGYKKGWFSGKLTKDQFKTEYEIAKRAKIPNPARSIAASQELVDRKFEKQYKKFYGKELGDIRSAAEREKIFLDFADKMQGQGMTFEEARDEFEKYFY